MGMRDYENSKVFEGRCGETGGIPVFAILSGVFFSARQGIQDWQCTALPGRGLFSGASASGRESLVCTAEKPRLE